jgi:hypothetical protein
VSAYTDPIGHQVDQYFLLRQVVEQAADNTNPPTVNTAIEEV